jgi:ATP adenylyltransferase
MDRLWSPWRYAYVTDAATARRDPAACAFCEALARPDGPENWVVRREERAFVILNKYPYNSGHLMVCPTRHVVHLSELTPEEGAALFSLAARAVDVLRASMNAEAVNLGANLGRAAGGSIDHLHVHAVPRWAGDTNFLPVTADTKVLVEMLDTTWRRLSGEGARWDGAAAAPAAGVRP